MSSATRGGALAGSAGGLVMVLAGLVLRPLASLPTLPELLQDRMVKLTPGALFGLLIDRLQYSGRPLLYSGMLLLELVVLALVGAAVATLVAGRDGTVGPLPNALALRRVLLLGLLVWLGIELVVLPLAGVGPFALGSRFASAAIFWGYLLEALLFSATTWWVLASLNRPAAAATGLEVGSDPLRRGVAASVGLAALATLGGTAIWRYRADLPAGLPGDASLANSSTASLTTAGAAVGTGATTDQAAGGAGANGAAQAPLLTPTSSFYVVSKNLDDPVVKAESWQLSVKGLVRSPFTLSYQALQALPAVEQYRTLACISNDVGGSLMSNASWRGVPLAALLDRAGADSTAGFVLFTSTDGYTESVPMALARQATTLVAYQINGVPLPTKHGFPARIVLAGRYGMKNPKWLTDVTVARDDVPGFWEQQGWDEQAVVRTTARIDGPSDGATVTKGPLAITGVAYAGDRGIQRVEVQLQPATSWQAATIQPVTAVSTWTAWRLLWTPPAAGSYRIAVRATDGAGTLQEAQAQDSFPLGAAGLHTIGVQVR